MGCVSSKVLRKRPTSKKAWYAPLSRSISTPARRSNVSRGDSSSTHVVSLTSSSYGILKMDRTGCQADHVGSFTNVSDEEDDFAFPLSGSDAKLKPVKEEDERLLLLDNNGDLETINTWELMEGLEEYGGRTPSPLRGIGAAKSRFHSGKSGSFGTAQELDSHLEETGSPVWRKYFTKEESMVGKRSYFNGDSPLTTPSTMSPFMSSSPIRSPSPNLMDSDATYISPMEPLDGNSGLKLLLSPAKSVSGHTSPFRNNSSAHGKNRSFDGDTERLHNISRALDGSFDLKSPLKSPDLQTATRCSSGINLDAFKGSNSPVFDPALMASFEQALQAVTVSNEDDWLHLNGDTSTMNSSTSSDSKAWAIPSETSSDEQTSPQLQSRPVSRERKISLSKILPVDEDDEGVLGSFEQRCPPRGEGKAVLYFTSLRGVRRTYEECCNVRLILQGFGVQVDERDVWMHSKFREELKEVLGTKKQLSLPRLFIKGRYIGGAEEVKQLHEEGTLSRLLEGLHIHVKVCDGCGDLRFVPCFTCYGSCKVINELDEVVCCSQCNENGLIMCPVCTYISPSCN